MLYVGRNTNVTQSYHFVQALILEIIFFNVTTGNSHSGRLDYVSPQLPLQRQNKAQVQTKELKASHLSLGFLFLLRTCFLLADFSCAILNIFTRKQTQTTYRKVYFKLLENLYLRATGFSKTEIVFIFDAVH